jgi:hypothetical protein
VDQTTRTFTASHTYADDDPTGTPADPYTLTATVTDDDGGVSGSLTASVTVRNVPPVFTDLTNTAAVPGNVLPGDPVTVSGSFTDPGADTHTVLINWGDSQTADTFVLPKGSRDFSFEHLYAQPNIYTISVTLTDDDGGMDQRTTEAFLSGVVLRNGVLYIIGTGSDDLAQVRESSGVVTVYSTFPKGPQTVSFRSGDVHSIAVYLAQGNDTLSVSLAGTPVRDLGVHDPDGITLNGIRARTDTVSVSAGGAVTVTDEIDASRVTLSGGSIKTAGYAEIEAQVLEMSAATSISVTTDADRITATAVDVSITQEHGLNATVSASALTVSSKDDVTLVTAVDSLSITAPSATITEADSVAIRSTLHSLSLTTTASGSVSVTETSDLTLRSITITDGAFSVTAAGTITAQSVHAGQVTLTATKGDIRVNLIEAGPSGSVVLTASKAIFETDSSGPASDLIAHSAVLTAGTTISGGSNRSLDLEITVDELTAAASNGDIFLRETDDIDLLSVTALGNDVTITAGGAVSGAVTADDLTVTATSGIDLSTRVTRATLTTTASGALAIADADALTILSATARNGAMSITAGGSLSIIKASLQTDAAGNTINLTTTGKGNIWIGSMTVGKSQSGFIITSAGSVAELAPADSAADLVGAYASITAAGELGSSSDSSLNLEFDVARLSFNGTNLRGSAVGAVVLDASVSGVIAMSSGGDLVASGVVTTGGSVTLTSTGGSIGVGHIDAGPSGTVTLTAASGSIGESGPSDPGIDLLGGTVVLSAGGNIGGGANGSLDLEVAVRSLQASSSGGAISLNETDDIALVSVTTSGKDVSITAGGSITVSGVLSTGKIGGVITLTSTNGSIGTDPSNSSRITAPALTLTATNGSIGVSTSVQTLTARVTGGAGGITVDERDSVTLALLTTQDGSIGVTAGGTITAEDVETLTDSAADSVTLITTSGDVLIDYVAAGYAAGAHHNGVVSAYSAHDIREAYPYDSAVDLRAHQALLSARGRIGGKGGADLELDVDILGQADFMRGVAYELALLGDPLGGRYFAGGDFGWLPSGWWFSIAQRNLPDYLASGR